jgi:hypothetical protein
MCQGLNSGVKPFLFETLGVCRALLFYMVVQALQPRPKVMLHSSYLRYGNLAKIICGFVLVTPFLTAICIKKAARPVPIFNRVIIGQRLDILKTTN